MTRGGRVRGVVLAVLRVAAGMTFIGTGLYKLLDHERAAADFERWEVPEPDTLSWVSGGLELAFGVVLVLGLSTRLAALLLLFAMLAATATAGRIEGGAHLVVPPVLALVCLVLLARGGGVLQLLDRLDPPRRG